MRRALAAFIASAVLAACGGEPLPPERPRPGRTAKIKKKKGKHGSEAIREKADGEAVSGQGKSWGGWRYGGDEEDCFFVVGRRCYATEKSACKAAKCGKQRCEVRGGGPARVTCG